MADNKDKTAPPAEESGVETPAPTPSFASADEKASSQKSQIIPEKQDEILVLEEEDSKPPPTVAATPVGMLPNENTFEDDGTFALPPGEEFKTTPVNHSGNNNKGAQVLMNRFSNWRQKANENATILWKQAKEAQEKAAANNQGPLAVLRQAAAGGGRSDGSFDDGVSHSSSGSGYDDDDEEDGYSSESSYYDNDELKNPNDDPPTSTKSMPNIPSRRSRRKQLKTKPADSDVGIPGSEIRSRVQNLASGVAETLTNEANRKELRSKAQSLATGVRENLDSVATGFRGRYAGNESPMSQQPTNAPSSPHSAAKESQTALILKSRAAAHLQDILDSLEPYQYVLLLGAGRLQVNLKDPYVKHQGTYVDFLVSGGAADKSGVVAVGDAIVKVGPQDVRKHTIADVPSIIAKAKRPVVLVLTTGVEMDVERITYLDLAVAMMHQIRAKDERQKQEMIASALKKKKKQEEKAASEGGEKEEDETKNELSEIEKEEAIDTEERQIEEKIIPEPEPTYDHIKIPEIRSMEEYSNPPQPPLEAREAYQHLVGKRCNDEFNVTQFSQVAASDDNFRAALRNAFLCCAIDGRRFPFLGRHLTMEQELIDHASSKQYSHVEQPSKNPPNALLMLFLELINFSELYGVTPVSRRREVAQRIAFKFFLPTKTTNAGGSIRLEPPIFDFHHIVPDSVLRSLEATLNNSQEDIPKDLFLDFQHAVVDALCGTTFLLFLVSNHCARMRGYLRNVAPFVNIPLKPVFEALTKAQNKKEALVHSGAKNYFLYVLIYLLQLEKDPTSTLSNDDSILLGRNGRRQVGAAGGLCCSIYIGRFVISAIRAFQKHEAEVPSSETEGKISTVSEVASIVQVFGHLWEVFVAPGVGALEHSWKSKETKEILEALRTKLRVIRKEVLTGGSIQSDNAEHKCNSLFARRFSSDQSVEQLLKSLADHLVYDYAIQTHSKFREHVFHEYFCNELVKAKKERSKAENKAEGGVEKTNLPDLPAGCIKRLLRKVDLPVGVSPHKPIKQTAPLSAEKAAFTSGEPNADCAVVFGTSVGTDLAARMMSPAMDHSDIRRYTCEDVTNSGHKLPESFEEEMIPPTLESYAVLPPTRLTGFSEVTGNVCLSSDGWEVSMVNFMIPKADDGSSEDEQDKSLYGVSLVFQRSSTARFYPRRISQSQLVCDDIKKDNQLDEKKTEENAPVKATIDDAGEFPSPLSLETSKDDHWSTFTRSIKVSDDTPLFNKRLREKPWVDRVLQDETRDQNVPATVGVALVSRRNVVIAMRQTLWMLLRDFSRMPDDEGRRNTNAITCGSLVDLMGNFAHQDVEGKALRCILEPYIRAASSPWIDRPLVAQKEEFDKLAGQQLITCLPPIPLALLFVATLLEQKIILSSSRRSILFSATAALTGMLKPLKWCHLLVPLVPSALARDLIQYPAPFILGMPSEDPGVMDIMNDLPIDVTLVDLDVGRVILAPSLSFDSHGFDGSAEENSTRMRQLRSQVLYLAQILGSHFGAKLFRDAWSCDSPSLTFRQDVPSTSKEADYDVLRSVCKSFTEELMAGISSSCFWIEEAASSEKQNVESTVLFDEDRFFHIKRWREENGYEPLLWDSATQPNRSLALNMDGFNLVLETFVRCQSMNWYLSSQPKEKMVFSL